MSFADWYSGIKRALARVIRPASQPLNPADPFILAILADPDNDVPRLAYANKLSEHGDPRAEFIRIQCQFARIPENHELGAELEAQQRRLGEKHAMEWMGGLDRWGGKWEFDRGFLTSLDLSFKRIGLEGAQSLATSPYLTFVAFEPSGEPTGRRGPACTGRLAAHRQPRFPRPLGERYRS